MFFQLAEEFTGFAGLGATEQIDVFNHPQIAQQRVVGSAAPGVDGEKPADRRRQHAARDEPTIQQRAARLGLRRGDFVGRVERDHLHGRLREARVHVGPRQLVEQVPSPLQPAKFVLQFRVGGQVALDVAALFGLQFAVEIGVEAFAGFRGRRVVHASSSSAGA